MTSSAGVGSGPGPYLGRTECLGCGREYAEHDALAPCPSCAAEGRHVNALPVYELGRLGSAWSADRTQPGIFAFRDLLPLGADVVPVSLGEGSTPLVPLRRLAERHGIGELWLKDESRNPTWSYKDRLAAVGVTKAVEWAADTVVVSSTGNHGAAVAAYAAAAGLRCVVLTVASVPETMKVLMQSYGARVVALERPTDRWVLMRQAVAEFGWVPLSGFVDPPAGSNPFALDGYKTMAYEIVEDLGSAPDVVVTPVAYGDGILGLLRGFADLLALGRIDAMPRLVAAEVFGPYGAALGSGAETARVASGPSVAFSIATPVSSIQGAHAITASGGSAVAVSDDGEIMRAQAELAASAGVFLEASAVLPIAALGRLRERGLVGPGDRVVCIGTSSGLKDVGAAAGRLPAVPVIEPSMTALVASLAGR